MKKIIALSALLATLSLSLHAQIHSTYIGGYWNDPNTWVGGVIPGSGNDVVIEGPVINASVNGYNILTEHCHNLIITTAGSLVNGDYSGGSGVYPLEVTGNVVNDGIVADGSSDALKIFISGDLENNNIWMPYQTEFQTSVNHNLSLAPGKSFGSMIINNGGPSFTALTDMLFTCDYTSDGILYRDNLNLNGNIFNVGNHSIELRKCLINSGTLTGDMQIKGTFKADMNPADTLVFVGNIVVNDTLTVNEYNGGYAIEKVKIIGDITNNGVVMDNDGGNPDDLSLLITGNFINNGIWNCNFVNLIGTGTQYITQSTGKQFDSYFTDLDSNSHVQALSDITILKDFNLNRTTLEMDGHILTINGWLYNGFINNTILHNGYLQNLTSLDNLIIEGLVTAENGNVFQNSVVINDTLQSKEYSGGSITYTLNIDGNIHNNGVIRNFASDDQLSLEITGDILNAGEWLHGFTKFSGTNTHHIGALAGHAFNGQFYDLDSIGSITVNNDIEFTGDFNLGKAIMDVQDSTITFRTDKWLYNGYLKNARLRNGMLSDMQLSGDTKINGHVEIGEGNYAIGNITVNDTLIVTSYNGGYMVYTFIVYGNIINKGLVGQLYDDVLYIKVNGNIINEGTWNAWKNCFLFYSNADTCSLTLTNNGASNLQVNSSAITGSGASAFSIISGGGMQTILPSQSYGATIQFTPTGADTTALLTLDCSQVGSLNTIELIGNNYDMIFTAKENYNPVSNLFVVNQNYPNPFNENTTISWKLPQKSYVVLRVYDFTGREIKTLLNCEQPMGEHTVNFNASTLPSGIYFYQLQTYGFVDTKKMTVFK